MRSAFLLCLAALFSALSLAQPKGYKPVADLKAFQQTLAKSTAAMQSLQSDFVQTKHLAMLSDKIVSKGKFYYRPADKVRIEYTTPFTYLLVMNAGRILIKDEQKSSRVNTRSSKLLQSVNRVMIDCMRGSVFSNPDFMVSAAEGAAGYVLTMVPGNAGMKKIFREINVYFSRSTLDVDRLTMTEQGGDYTDMDFSNARRNLSIPDALFTVR